MSSIFGDMMTLLDIGQKVATGDIEGAKRELLRDDAPAQGEPAAPAPAPCAKAPEGYKCLGTHDERGRCMTLEALP